MAAGGASLLWGDRMMRVLEQGARPLTDQLPSGVRAALPAASTGWRIYAVSPPMPRFDPTTWTLQVTGLVERSLTLDYEQLRRLPRSDQTNDFHCVTGWTVDDVRWTGVRLGELLDRAGVLPGARVLRFVSMERPYVDTLTLPQARLNDVLLAYDMDGRPLSREHGAPLRLVMPRMYGYKSVKWLGRIELVSRSGPGYWEQRGYDRDAWIDSSDAI